MSGKSNTSQAVWIAVGNMFSTGIAIVSAMILSRYFDKEDYGTYKQVIYIYSTMQIVFTLGLPRCFSYFLPRIPITQAKHTISKITNIFYITGTMLMLLLFFGAQSIADGLKNDNLADAIRIYSPVAFFLLPTLGLEGILATYKKCEYIALYNALTRIFILLCVVIPVIVFGGTYKMALWGFVISSFITFLLAVYLKELPLKGLPKEKSTIRYRDIWKFSLPLMTTSIWATLISASDQFFISRYFGTEAFANFSNGSLQLPFVGMVTTSIVTVLTPVFSEYISEGKPIQAIELWKRSTIKCMMLLFPLIIFFITFAKPLMVVMFGGQYSDSGIFFQIKQVESFLQIVNISIVLFALGLTSHYSKVYMCCLLGLIPTEYLISIWSDYAYSVTIGHMVFSFFNGAAIFVIVSRKINLKIHNIIPFIALIRIVSLSIIVALITLVIGKIIIIGNILLYLIIMFVIFCLIYFCSCHLFGLNYKEIIMPILCHNFRNLLNKYKL